MSVTEVTAVQARNDLAVLDLAEYSTVEGFMQKVFHKSRSSELNHTNGLPTSAEIDEFDRTSNLIEGASKAIETLSNRCEILSNELAQERTHSSEQEEHIEALKRVLLDLKGMNAAYEADIKAMTLRCQTNETRIVELEQSQKVVTLRASKAETISNRLQQQVEAAFGLGSPIRSVMDSVKLQQAAE